MLRACFCCVTSEFSAVAVTIELLHPIRTLLFVRNGGAFSSTSGEPAASWREEDAQGNPKLHRMYVQWICGVSSASQTLIAILDKAEDAKPAACFLPATPYACCASRETAAVSNKVTRTSVVRSPNLAHFEKALPMGRHLRAGMGYLQINLPSSVEMPRHQMSSYQRQQTMPRSCLCLWMPR